MGIDTLKMKVVFFNRKQRALGNFSVESYFKQIRENLPPTIETLDVSCNELQVVKNLPNTIKKLDLSHNNIRHLYLLPTNLIEFKCTGNKTLTIFHFPPNLQKIDVSLNMLTFIPELPPVLKKLNVDINKLIELPYLPPTLEILECRNNSKLTYLPPLPEGLIELDFNSCNVFRIPLLPESIMHISCSWNPVHVIENIPNNINIRMDWSTYNIYSDYDDYDGMYRVIDFMQTPIYDAILDFPSFPHINYIDKCRDRLLVVNRFRILFYSLKCKKRLMRYLLDKVRRPKIELANHPDRLQAFIDNADPDEDLADVIEKFIKDNNHF